MDDRGIGLVNESKIAVITGAASGIGRALSIELADAGYLLALADLDITELKKTLAIIRVNKEKHLIHRVDVCSREGLEKFARIVEIRFGKVDVLINNAGMTYFSSFSQSSIEPFERVINVNLFGTVYGCYVFLPLLRRAKVASIVNIASVFGLVGFPCQSAYCASKFAVRGFSETLRMELKGEGIDVLTVLPGGVKTNIANNAKIEDASILGINGVKRIKSFDKTALSTPENVAKAIRKGLDKRSARLLIGPDATIIDCLVRVFPSFYQKILRILLLRST